MEVVPVDVGTASRAWDDQHLFLQAASAQVLALPVVGFTPPVVLAASRFVLRWQAMLGTLARQCETEADGLRTAIADYVHSDGASFVAMMALLGYLHEHR